MRTLSTDISTMTLLPLPVGLRQARTRPSVMCPHCTPHAARRQISGTMQSKPAPQQDHPRLTTVEHAVPCPTRETCTGLTEYAWLWYSCSRTWVLYPPATCKVHTMTTDGGSHMARGHHMDEMSN